LTDVEKPAYRNLVGMKGRDGNSNSGGGGGGGGGGG
jgi:hypothetical protein